MTRESKNQSRKMKFHLCLYVEEKRKTKNQRFMDIMKWKESVRKEHELFTFIY